MYRQGRADKYKTGLIIMQGEKDFRLRRDLLTHPVPRLRRGPPLPARLQGGDFIERGLRGYTRICAD